PEVIAGSTRMKAGTAQKMVLNMLSTVAMVRLGYVYDNLMINMLPTNKKLKERTVRILEQASGRRASTVEHAMRQARHDTRAALIMLRTNVDAQRARELLDDAKGNVRQALAAARK